MDGYGVGEPFFSRRLEENVNLLMKALKDPALPLLELQVIIIQSHNSLSPNSDQHQFSPNIVHT